MSAPEELPGPDSPRVHVAHVLFIDIVGYSTLSMDQQRALLNDLQEAVRSTRAVRQAQAADQIVALPTGDGMALVFLGSPEDPVRCAVEVTRALANRTDLPLRMGVHTGPVYRVADINANQNVSGGGINIAQRVMDCGDAGHVLVSDASARMLMQLEEWRERLHDLGEATVKHDVRVHLHSLWMPGVGNKARPSRMNEGAIRQRPWRQAAVATVAAFLLVAAALAWWRPWQRHEDRVTSVVALPATVYGAPEYAFLTDAIPATLSTQLAQVPGLETKMPPSSADFARLKGDITRAGQAYGVSACVLTSVSAESERLRLNIQLVQPTTRRVIWSEEYDGAKAQYLGLVRSAANGVRDAMRLRGESRTTAAIGRSSELELAFRRGQYHARRLLVAYSAADFDAATSALMKVVDQDPRAADAAAELAFVYMMRIFWSEGSVTQADALARRWASQAIALEPRNALAWASLAWADVFGMAGVTDRTIEAGLKSASSGPDCALCQSALGTTMVASIRLGYPPEVEALRLEPLNIVPMNNAGVSLGSLGRFDEAIAHYDDVLSLEPSAGYARIGKLLVLIREKRLNEATALLASVPGADHPMSGAPGSILTAKHALRRLAGDTAAADALLTEIRSRMARPGPPNRVDLAWIQNDVVPSLASSGRIDEALDILERTMATGDTPALDWLDADPGLARLHGLPRFEAVRRKAGMALDHLLDLLDAARERGELPPYLEPALVQERAMRGGATRN